MNKIIICPCRVKFWNHTWSSKSRWIRKWYTGIAVVAGTAKVLVWVEDDLCTRVRNTPLLEVPKDRIRVVKP